MTRAFRLPRTLTLPSGTRVTLRERAAPVSGERAEDEPMLFSDALALVRNKVALVSEASEERELDVLEMPLSDFHVLRALLTKAGLLHEDLVSFLCINCDEELSTRPCEGLETAPWEDGELDDPELDTLAPCGEPLEIEPIELGRVRTVRTITLAPRTVRDVLPLWRAAGQGPLVIEEHLVSAIGLSALGPMTAPARIADALAHAGRKAQGRIFEAFLAAHYPLRLARDVLCPTCHARNTVEAPALREFDLAANPIEPQALGASRSASPSEGASRVPSFEEFVARAQAMAAPHIEALPGERVVLVVEDGTPGVDDGGTPLLGSYVPPPPSDALVPMTPPTVTIYYRTFVRIQEEDSVFDWEEELQETIEHELEHHMYFLRGDDPMDAEEREEIARDMVRVIGRREATRRTRSELVGSAIGFVRHAWPLLAILALALALVLAQERCT